jgi:hypothetical protein
VFGCDTAENQLAYSVARLRQTVIAVNGAPATPLMGTLEQEYCGTCDICGKEADAEVEVGMGLDVRTPWLVQQQ